MADNTCKDSVQQQQYLEQDLSPEDVANASDSCLVHQDGAHRLLADLHLLPQQLPISICSQRIWPKLGCLLVVVLCIKKLIKVMLNHSEHSP